MLSTLVSLLFLVTVNQTPELLPKPLKNMTVSCGTYNDRIVLEWQNINRPSYTVLRSQMKRGEFITLVQTAETKYEDTSAVKGIRYWYKIIPESADAGIDENGLFITDEEYSIAPEKPASENGVKPADVKKEAAADNQEQVQVQVNNYSGYAMPDKPAGIKLDNLIKQKKSSLKTPADNEEKTAQNRRLAYIKEFYMNPIKFSLVMTMAKPYLEKGELIILTDVSAFNLDHPGRIAVLSDESYSYMVTFNSSKFFKIIENSQDPELNDILLKNSELFSIYSGRSEIVDKDGLTRIVHSYDAVGLSTRYLKNDKEWKSRTLLIPTSRSDLKEKLKSVSKSED